MVLGFFVFAAHVRGRFGDCARVSGEPLLNPPSGDRGFVEAAVVFGNHKTGHGARKAAELLPLVGLALGVSGRPWAAAWLRRRSELGLNAGGDRCLFPLLLSDGRFGDARMDTAEGDKWLQYIGGMLGWEPEYVKGMGTHSAKATLLTPKQE